MKKYSEFNNNLSKIESTIKNKAPKDAIKIINKICDNKDNSLKIYKVMADKSVLYNEKENRYNINSYKKNVNKNISIAERALKNIKN
jgi:hypothetical protein